MGCEKKIKYTCGTKVPSPCVSYELDVPDISKLNEETCVTVEETTEDIYKLLESIKKSIDLSKFDKGCLDIDTQKNSYSNENEFTVVDVLGALKNKVCNTTETNKDEDNIAFILENLDYKCLKTKCDTKPGNLFQFFQLLIDNICDE